MKKIYFCFRKAYYFKAQGHKEMLRSGSCISHISNRTRRLQHTQINNSLVERATDSLDRLSSRHIKERPFLQVPIKTKTSEFTNKNNGKYRKNFIPADLRRPISVDYKFHRNTPLLFDRSIKNTIFEESLTSSKPNYEKLSIPNVGELPKLEHKLSRVLFSPGVHYLQDPRSQVYNFDPHLSEILPNDQFDFDSITKFVSSSKDTKLAAIAKENKAKYYSSTSSMTGVLSHMHYLLSNFRPQSLLEFTKHVPYPFGKFTKGAKLPASIIVRKNGNVYSIDSEKSTDKEMILSLQGHSLERMLTKTPKEFEKYRIDEEKPRTEIEREENVYHYAKLENFIMRSQLDCQDERLPGTGTFDLKTRAVSAVRFDLAKVERDSTGYQIIKNYGTYESFEREHYDLVKSTLLKYSLQARIGDMDGIFIAYHNTVRMFGFEYLPLTKIDEILHSFGLPDLQESRDLLEERDDEDCFEILDLKNELCSKMANDEFKLSMSLWNRILEQSIKQIPDSSFRFITKAIPLSDFETKLRVIITPIEQDEIEELQNINRTFKSKLMDAVGNEVLIEETIDKQIEYVDEMNQTLCRTPIGFDIYLKNFIDNQECFYRHPIYNNLESSWNIKTKFVRLSPNDAFNSYNEFLKQRTKMMSMRDRIQDDDEVDDFVKILRQYSERGKRILNNKDTTVIWNNE